MHILKAITSYHIVKTVLFIQGCRVRDRITAVHAVIIYYDYNRRLKTIRLPTDRCVYRVIVFAYAKLHRITISILATVLFI